MALGGLGTAQFSAEIQQYYSDMLLTRAKPHLVHDIFGKKANIPKHGGVSVNWRRVERPSASTTALTEGTAGASADITISSVSVTVQQYG